MDDEKLQIRKAFEDEEKLQIRKTFDVLLDRMFNEESEYQSLFIDFPYWNEKDEKGYIKLKRYKITISKYDRKL